MSWSKVGQLWPALSAKIDGLVSQQSQLMQTAATVDELTVSTVISGYITGAGNPTTMYQYLNGTNTVLQTIWVAPYACRIVSCSFWREYTDHPLGTAGNTAAAILLRTRGGTWSEIARRDTLGAAWPARSDWNLDGATWSEDARTFAKGDGIMVGLQALGSAQIRYPITITCRVQPL